MSDIAKDKAARLLKKRGSLSSLSSHDIKTKENMGKQKDSMSTVSYMDDPGHHDDIPRPTLQMENTYQLGEFPDPVQNHGCYSFPVQLRYLPELGGKGILLWHLATALGARWVSVPSKYFPGATVNNILKDVLTSYLQEEKYEPELCRQMTKTISEVIKARVKDLMIPRYKIIVLIHIGQLNDQSMRIGSRCLWDSTTDTFSSFSFCNRSLFAVANVYAVYFE